jgi:hypothetical protein
LSGALTIPNLVSSRDAAALQGADRMFCIRGRAASTEGAAASRLVMVGVTVSSFDPLTH